MRGSITQRGGDKWFLRVPLGTINGKRKTLTKTVTGGRREAERELARMVATAADRRAPAVDQRTKLRHAVATWQKRRAADPAISESTRETQNGNLERHILPALGSARVTAIQPEDVEDFYLDCLGSGLSRQTVSGLRAILSSVFESIRGLPMNPAKAAKLPGKPAAHEVRILSAEELSKVLAVAATSVLDLHVRLLLASGIRRGELLALQWEDVDQTRGGIHIRNNLQKVRGELVLLPPKTANSRRFVSLPENLLADLQQCRRDQLRRHMARGIRPARAIVFPTRAGEFRSPRGFSYQIKELCGRVGVQDVGPHTFRHQHASQLLHDGVNPKSVSTRLGHSSVTFTMNTYAHCMPDEDEALAAVSKWKI